MPNPKSSGSAGGPRRSSRKAKSPMNSILAVGVALVVFIATIGIAVSLLNKDKSIIDDPSQESSSSQPDGNAGVNDSQPISEANGSSSDGEGGSPDASGMPAITPTSTSSSSAASSSSSSAAESPSSSASSSSSSAPAASTAKFDPEKMGSSGFGNIATYKKINPDVKGWLRVPGTNINYPVLFSNDVMYYLDKNIYKQKDKNGVLWADPMARTGLSSEIGKNTVIYGHNWSNVGGTYGKLRIADNTRDVMFAQLPSYTSIDFAKTNPYIYYSTEAEEMVWKVFAVFYTDIGFNYIDGVPTDAGLTNIINGAKARSIFNFGTEVSNQDKILTLSTCTRVYGPSDRQRFVVMARLVRPSEQLTEVSVSVNPNPVKPNL